MKFSVAIMLPLAVPLLLWGLAWGDELPAQYIADWQPLVGHAQGKVGMWSCAASNCHGGDRRERMPPQRSGGEIEIYTSSDPHARAGAILTSEAFEQILVRLKIVATEKNTTRLLDAARLQECMNCHNPAQMEHRWSAPIEKDSHSAQHSIATTAFDCETCHGPAQAWLKEHVRPGWNRAAAVAHGFRDNKNLLVRARACAQCHVGDESRDMNHDMIAAGHPPLQFELASYLAKLPKHWNDGKARSTQSNLELQLWLVGQVASFDSSLALLASRAQRAAAPEVIDDRAVSGAKERPSPAWPEFAEYSCTACHQTLTSSAGWSKEKQARPPQDLALKWNGWNQGFVDFLLQEMPVAKEDDRRQLAEQIAQLEQGMEAGIAEERAALLQLSACVEKVRGGDGESCGLHEFGSRAWRHLQTLPTTKPNPLGTFALHSSLPEKWNADRATHAYAFLVATVQSQYDEAAKQRVAASVSPELLQSLQAMKQNLAPPPGHPFAPASKVWEQAFTQHVQRAAQQVEGARRP